MLYGRDSPDRKIHLILLLTDGKEISTHLAEKLNNLAQYAAIIPVISKADTYESNEIRRAKEIFSRCSRVAGVEWFDARTVELNDQVFEKQSEQSLPRNDKIRSRSLSAIRSGKCEQLHN